MFIPAGRICNGKRQCRREGFSVDAEVRFQGNSIWKRGLACYREPSIMPNGLADTGRLEDLLGQEPLSRRT